MRRRVAMRHKSHRRYRRTQRTHERGERSERSERGERGERGERSERGACGACGCVQVCASVCKCVRYQYRCTNARTNRVRAVRAVRAVRYAHIRKRLATVPENAASGPPGTHISANQEPVKKCYRSYLQMLFRAFFAWKEAHSGSIQRFSGEKSAKRSIKEREKSL